MITNEEYYNLNRGDIILVRDMCCVFLHVYAENPDFIHYQILSENQSTYGNVHKKFIQMLLAKTTKFCNECLVNSTCDKPDNMYTCVTNKMNEWK